MATKETQKLILETSIKLFNESGTRHVSTNRIAEACGLSKGNLHYHFKNKESVIQSIFELMARDIEKNWNDDYLQPTAEHMAEMFYRQLKMIWDYRFFYRELTPLLQKDQLLKDRFCNLRKKRVVEVEKFFKALIAEGFLVGLDDPEVLSSLITIGWIISDYWISFIDIEDKEINKATIKEGYLLMVQSLVPYLTDEARENVDKSFSLLSESND